MEAEYQERYIVPVSYNVFYAGGKHKTDFGLDGWAPTCEEVQAWFLKEHKIKISVDSSTVNMKGEWKDWTYTIRMWMGPGSIFQESLDARDGLDSRYEALNAAFIRAFELLEEDE